VRGRSVSARAASGEQRAVRVLGVGAVDWNRGVKAAGGEKAVERYRGRRTPGNRGGTRSAELQLRVEPRTRTTNHEPPTTNQELALGVVDTVLLLYSPHGAS
jgi:hypothetical protein